MKFFRKKEKSVQNFSENLEFPKEINEKETTNKKKKKGLFSWAIFKESIKSNWMSWSIVSVGNAVLAIVVVMILSGININSTKNAMSSMFENADLEATLKSGVIGYYSAFEQSAETYETFNKAQKQAVEALTSIYQNENFNNVETIKTYINAFETIYKTNLNNSNHETAKNKTINLIKPILDKLPNIDEEKKNIIITLIGTYLDIYNENIENAENLKNTLIDSINVYKERTNGISDKEVLNKIAKEVSIETILDIIPLIGGDELGAQASYLVESLKSAYEENKDYYINNTDGYFDKSLSEGIQFAIITSLTDYSYYNFLPNYTVKYVTSVNGLPLIKVDSGEVDENGQPIFIEEEATTYEPDKFIKTSSSMGAASGMLEKKNKEIITGKPYSDKEIQEARNEAQESTKVIKEDLNNFMNEFITRDENNQNKYFNNIAIVNDKEIILEESYIRKDIIKEESIELINEMGNEQLITMYNDQNEDKIDSIDELPSSFLGMTGEYIGNLIRSYATSGVEAFIDANDKYLKEGYSTIDAMLVAMSIATKTVTGSLPPGLTQALTEIGEMNTYGFIIGGIVFGMACILMPLVYTIILSNSLVAEKVETGSLAFTLATPTKRSTFVFTQAMYLIISEIASGLVLFLGAFIAREVGILLGGTDFIESLPLDHILKFAAGSSLVIVAMSGICFLTSCIFNKTRFAIGVGGGINIFFFICSILGLFGSPAMPTGIRIDSMNMFNYVTINSLFDSNAVIFGDNIYYVKLIFLVVIALICYFIGIKYFERKDLPL